MLSAQNRMRSGSDFTAAVRRGRRAGRQAIVLHYLTVAGPAPDGAGSPLVGFVVPKSVGTAVTRNRIERRLRHLMRDWVTALPVGSRLVVRAQPASVRTADLGAELDRALSAVLQDRPGRSDRPGRRAS